MFFVQNEANSAQPLIWVLGTPVKKFKKLCYPILVPFKNATFLPVEHFSQGVPILLFFPKWFEVCTAPLKVPKNSYL